MGCVSMGACMVTASHCYLPGSWKRSMSGNKDTEEKPHSPGMSRAVFCPIWLWAGRYSRFKWQENQNGRNPADPAGDKHPYPC